MSGLRLNNRRRCLNHNLLLHLHPSLHSSILRYRLMRNDDRNALTPQMRRMRVRVPAAGYIYVSAAESNCYARVTAIHDRHVCTRPRGSSSFYCSSSLTSRFGQVGMQTCIVSDSRRIEGNPRLSFLTKLQLHPDCIARASSCLRAALTRSFPVVLEKSRRGRKSTETKRAPT